MLSLAITGIVYLMSFAVILASVLPIVVNPHWAFRVFDFPRLQITCAAIISLAGLAVIIVCQSDAIFALSLAALLSIITVYQCWWIFPYTKLHKKHVKNSRNHGAGVGIKLIAANVLQTNTEYEKLLEVIHDNDPDIIVTLESDSTWEKALKPRLQNYPHCIAVPQDNLYGMHVFSRLPLLNSKVLYRVKDDIPSITADISVADDMPPIHLYFIHPMPPSPTEADESTSRDQELILVAREIDDAQAYIVAGDLNDVAWSRTTRLFRKLSGLLDPRIGRGFFNTFHAHWRLLRWPLDHVFVSRHFTVDQVQRLPDIGSDHFPIMLAVSYHNKYVNDTSEETQEGASDMEQAVLDDRMNETK